MWSGSNAFAVLLTWRVFRCYALTQNRSKFEMIGVPQLRLGSPPVQVLYEPSIYSSHPTCETPACSDAATSQTIRRMCALIQRAAGNDFFSGAARAVPFMFGKRASLALALQRLDRPSREKAACAIACWWFTREFIEFVSDQALVRRLTGDPASLEGLMGPDVMIRCVKPQGDCDCFTMFLCALLQCLGVEWEIVALACSPRQPGIWSHVFPRAVIGSLHLALDASHGKFPGWSVPRHQIQRFAAFDPSGNLAAPHQRAMVDEEVM